jgi:tRNA(His) guanylyltransferase
VWLAGRTAVRPYAKTILVPSMATTGDRDEFGNRMKGYEAVETSRILPPGLPHYARIDGRAFSTFTRSMQRPFDPRMTAAMIATAKHLVGSTGARIGYVQSDEISLVWLDNPPEIEPLFGSKVHKLTSVLASLAAASFQHELRQSFDSVTANTLCEMLPHFDARVFSLPSKAEAANAVLWRTLDARKNAVSMATRAFYPAKAMHGADQAEMLAMLTDKGIDFEAYPDSFKFGTWLRRAFFDRALSDEQRAAIPEKYRPPVGAVVSRSDVCVVEMPEFAAVRNRAEVIFDGADPITEAKP